MKNGLMKKLALLLTVCMVASSFAGCGKKDENTNTTETKTEQASTSDTTETNETTEAKNDTLVVGYDYFSSKFSPFFAKTAYDVDVASITGISLCNLDREGNLILNGKDGVVIPYNGTDYTYTTLSNCEVVQNDDGTVDYNFVMRDDVTFSDGTPITVDDVIFSMYVFSDPTYDGSSTFYAAPIVGMEEYRSGMETLSSLIIAAGQDNKDFTNWTEEQQTTYWAAIEKAGAKFAQEIVDYCAAGYADMLPDYGDNKIALGMAAWGFGTLSDDGTKITGEATGTEYELSALTIENYWAEIVAKYEGDLATASETETAGTDLFTFANEELGDAAADFAKGVNTGESVPNIEGIVKTGDNTFTVTTSAYDAAAIYHIAGLSVAPLHYYGSTDLFNMENNTFGFPKGDLSSVNAKTTQPLGAGPYKFVSYENGVVTLEANENFYLGEPKIKNILFKETSESDKLAGVTSGAFDLTEPALNVTVLESIKGYNSNGEVAGDKVYTDFYDFLGYGYIGINSDNVKVGNDKQSEESKNLRKAFATVLAVYRDTVVNSYYGEMASVIQYPISNTSWAAPKPADEGYAIAYSKDVEGNPIYTEGMSDEDKYAAALDAAVGFFKAAGYTYDEASKTFTAAPAGANMAYEIIIPANGGGDHPSFGVLTAAKDALATIGITLEINDPADSNILWSKTESGTAEMWCAAWGATPDPDMYQVYFSKNVVGGGGTNSNTYGLQDDKMDELIMAARTSADQAYRKATYGECLDIILDWAVEVPVYQRQNGLIYSAERVNIDTLTKDMTPYWKWYSEVELLEMN